MTQSTSELVAEKLADAWISSAFEYDRSILVVASAGLGLVATLADKLETIGPNVANALTTAAVTFTLVIAAVLLVFQANKRYISASEGSMAEAKWEQLLKFLDIFLVVAFLVGIASVAVATTSLLNTKGPKRVNREYTPEEIVRMAERGELTPSMESLAGAKVVLRNKLAQPVTSSQPPLPQVNHRAAPPAASAAREALIAKPKPEQSK